MTNWTFTKYRQIPLCLTRTDIKITMESLYGGGASKMISTLLKNGRRAKLRRHHDDDSAVKVIPLTLRFC
jgi:hypothetical protein